LKVDLQAFVEGAGHALNGMMMGQMAGQEQARQQQQQEFNQQLNLAQLGANQQQQQNQLLLSQLPRMTDASAAAAVTNVAAQPSPYAGMLNTRYAQQHPEVGQILGGTIAPPAPQGAPGGWMGAAAGQRIPPPVVGAAAPGGAGQPVMTVNGQQYALKGVDPKAVAHVTTGMDQALGDMRKVILTDPRQIAARDEYFRARAALGTIDTPEKLQAANQLYQGVLSFQSSVGGPQARAFEEGKLRSDQGYHKQQVKDAVENLDDAALAGALPDLLKQEKSLDTRREGRGGAATGIGSSEKDINEIEQMIAAGDQEGAARLASEVRRRWKSKLTPQQSLSAQKSAMQFLGQFNPRQITPDLVRQAFKDAPGLIEGMSDEQLKGYGSKGLETEWEKDFAILSNPKRWAGMPKEARQSLLREISGTAALTGRKLDIPADVVLDMTPQERESLRLRAEQLHISGGGLMQARARLKFDEDKFDWAKTHPTGRGKAGDKSSILTMNSKAKQLHDLWKESNDNFNRALTGVHKNLATFDPEHPTGPQFKPNGQETTPWALARLYRKTQERSKALKAFLLQQGLDVDAGEDTPVPTAAGGTKKAYKDMTPEELTAAFAAAAAAKLKAK
jgi:hypothetical protein